MMNLVSRMKKFVLGIVFEILCMLSLTWIAMNKPEWDIVASIVIILVMIFVVPIYFIISLLRVYYGKSASDKQLEKEAKGPEYYRDIMHEKSPLLMAYLYHKRIRQTDMMAHLNYLHRKKIISINEGKIEVLKTPSYEEDIYILNHINMLDHISVEKDLKRIMKKKAQQDGYLQTNITERIVALIFAILLLFHFFGDAIWLILFLLLCPIFLPITISLFATKSRKDILYYSKKGYETLSKLKGLKKFLEDFGVMENKTSDDIILYEDYIVYGIILECSKSLVEDAKKDLNLIAQKERNQS